MSSVDVRLVPGEMPNRISLSRWVRYVCRDASIADALLASDVLRSGGTWSPSYDSFDRFRAKEDSEFAIITITSPFDAMNREYAEQAAKMQEYGDLLIRGANGDVEAAIAYCKLELAGEICHAAFAG